MEPIGAIAEGDWSSLSGIYTTEEADFMAQLLGNCPLPNQLSSGSDFGVSSTFWPSHESEMNMVQINNEGSIYSSEVSNASFFHFSQGSSNYSAGSSSFFPSSSQEGYYLSDSHPVLAANHSSSMFGMGDVANPAPFLVEADDCSNHEMSNGNLEESGVNQPEAALPECSLQPRRDSDMQVTEPSAEDKGIEPCQNPKKRSRSSEDVEKNKRSVRSKKSQKVVSTSNNDEGSNAGVNGPASSSCLSEDESNASHELNGAVSSSLSSKGNPALNLNGKTRASRGAATDPQSLYARKRRERINERLRILQNLVPNGTKVDISTMLEEAVQYVKFLQLQIKLLSSDDLWMYAPIAYNGMNIGLDLKVPTPKSS